MPLGTIKSRLARARLRLATERYRNTESWRQRREVSLAIFNRLKLAKKPELGLEIAEAMTDVSPEAEWLTASEARQRLLECGVRVYPKLLYRFYRKARQSPRGVFAVAMSADGDWLPASIRRAKPSSVLLTIRVLGAVHFKVSRLRPKV